MSTTETEIRLILDERFGGVLTKGSHAEDGQACALELLSVVRGIPWTDDPRATRTWDLRALNDVDVSDEVRTKHLVPVLAAFAGSFDWPIERQQAVAIALVIGTVREIVAELPTLPLAIAEQCRQAKTLAEVATAARAARAAARAARAAWVAGSAAARAADSAADSAASAACAADSAASAASAADSADNSADNSADTAWATARTTARTTAWAADRAADWAAASAEWSARAADSAASAAAWAADWAADTAAAKAAASAAAEKVFVQACSVWRNASQASF